MKNIKKSITIFAILLMTVYLVLFGTGTIKAHAFSNGSNIAIIDTGYDPSIKQFAGKIIYEKCVSGFMPTCPNKQYSQEGIGSAALSSTQLSIAGSGHGNEMLSGSIQTNPNTKFVFIRAYSIFSNIVFSPTDIELTNILNWIYQNKDIYNIGAVVFSAGRATSGVCPTNANMLTTITNLRNSGIPTVISAGNRYDYKNIDFPACLNQAISIGAAWDNTHQLFSNYGNGLSFDANGSLYVTSTGNTTVQSTGTSIAAQIFAASWIAIHQAKPSLTLNQEYNLINQTSTISKNQFINSVPTLNLAGALK